MDEYFEEVSLPYTSPIHPRTIVEMLAGKQIARLVCVFEEKNPWGGVMAGLELTDTTRLAIMAWPTPAHPTFRARLGLQLFDTLKIVTPSMLRHFTRSRAAAGERPPNEVEDRVEGEVILGVPETRQANEFGGETIRLELLSGRDLLFLAVPVSTAAYTANLAVRIGKGRKRHVVVVGSGRGGRRGGSSGSLVP